MPASEATMPASGATMPASGAARPASGRAITGATLGLLFHAVCLGACGGGEENVTPAADADPNAPDAAPGGPDAGNPLGSTIVLEVEPFDVQPGTERQVCKIVNLPSDVPIDVVRMHSTMVGTSHHFNAYKAVTNPTAPVTGGDGVVHDCQPADEQLGGDAAYIFGAATPERDFDTPPGVAFHLVPQQRIILEQHVINSSDAVVQGGVTFTLYTAAPGATIEHHADIIWFANWGFFIPPGGTSDTEFCTVPYAVEVFGLMSHTHALGTHFSIEKYSGGATTHLYDSYDWAHPPYEEYTNPTVSLAAGEGLQWTCEWQNPTGSTVLPGKNSTDEMCITFAAAYPRDSLTGDPIQCNKPFAP